jgi:hypothetical protein
MEGATTGGHYCHWLGVYPGKTTMIIGITGYAGHGKDTVAKILIEDFGYRRIAFADKVREAALAIDPMVDVELHVPIRLTPLISKIGWDKAKQFPDVRRLLQRVGTDMGRNIFGQNIWIQALFDQIIGEEFVNAETYNWVIPDVRFDNEANEIVDAWHGKMWRVSRPGFDNGIGTEHTSEALIATLPVTAELANDGTIDDLRHKIHQLMV